MRTSLKRFFCVASLLGAVVIHSSAAAAPREADSLEMEAGATVTREDTDGVLEADEYRVISMNGAVTRRPCPYTCEQRGVPKASCKTWLSDDKAECYVHDTRLPSGNVMPSDTKREAAKSDSAYKH